MGWAETRIREYQHGRPAKWLERRMLEHANPVHFALALAASVGFVYGLWTHAWSWIIGSAALAALGHVYCWTRDGGKSGPDRSSAKAILETPARAGRETTMLDDLSLDDQGRFQMASDELDDFIRYLRENEVQAETETRDAFHSEGRAYGYGRLLNRFDFEAASNLYRTWRELQESLPPG